MGNLLRRCRQAIFGTCRKRRLGEVFYKFERPAPSGAGLSGGRREYGTKVMLACRQTGSDILTMAAYAGCDDVFFATGNRNNVVHETSGVDGYFSDNCDQSEGLL